MCAIIPRELSTRSWVAPSLAQYIPPEPGPIIDLVTGEKVGMHQGLWTFTIGQGAKLAGMNEKTYVARKDVVNNTVFVVRGTYADY
jgi:tRNA U34 2-thiouridine synthase MnmA/TrmU